MPLSVLISPKVLFFNDITIVLNNKQKLSVSKPNSK